MRVGPSFLKAAILWTTCIGIGFAANALDEEVAFAVEWPAVQLEFDFVSESVEEALTCDVFLDCLHLEVLETAQCKSNVAIDMGFEDKFSQLIGGYELIVPSPGHKGGFVIEVGSNEKDAFDVLSVYTVSCSSVLANVVAIS